MAKTESTVKHLTYSAAVKAADELARKTKRPWFACSHLLISYFITDDQRAINAGVVSYVADPKELRAA